MENTGQNGYADWTYAFEKEVASTIGTALNAGCWRECRTLAVAFPKEAKQQNPGTADSQFNTAIEDYRLIHEQLKSMSELFPIKSHQSCDPIKAQERSHQTIEILKKGESWKRRDLSH